MKTTIDVRTKLRIVALFKDGATVADILRKYPEISKGSLVAIKANVTRGNFK